MSTRGEAIDHALEQVARDDFAMPLLGEGASQAKLSSRHPRTHVVGDLVAGLELPAKARVLHIGTGSGYVAAVLARLAGEVYSVERLQSLAALARQRLAEAGVKNATVVVGDGAVGLAEKAPYDGILVSAPLT